jgi:hypothetical protein
MFSQLSAKREHLTAFYLVFHRLIRSSLIPNGPEASLSGERVGTLSW